ncbi:MAG TPA: STAS/SEC14 domain-containing protein [Polyangiaceae bacterium]
MDFQFDETSWPIVVLRWQGRPTDASVTAGLARLDAFLARKERFGLIVDSRGSTALTPEQRGMMLAHMKRNMEENEKYLVQAFVANDFIARTLYWGVQLFMPPPFPSKVFGEFEAARAWVADVLGASERR